MDRRDGHPLIRSSDPHRWVPGVDRKRHAAPSEEVFAVGDELTMFCGVRTTVDDSELHQYGLHKECVTCNAVVHDLLGIPLVPANTDVPRP